MMSIDQDNSSFSFAYTFRRRTILTATAILLPALALALTLSSPYHPSSSYLSSHNNYDEYDNTTTTQIQAIQSQLLGTWHMESLELKLHLPSPPPLPVFRLTIWTHYPFGRNPKGLLLYTADGYMSAQLMRRQSGGDYARFANDIYQFASDKELACAARGYLAYSGTYTVGTMADADIKTPVAVVNHSVHVSLFPNWLGSTQTRIVWLEGDRLMLVPPEKEWARWKVRYQI